MKTTNLLYRRSFLQWLAASPLLAMGGHRSRIPVGLELYSVRDDLQKDLPGTVRAVARLGYQCVEFYSPYYDWTPDYARQVRAELDELGIRCYSTHNEMKSFTPEGLSKAIELNKILGTHYVVLAHSGKITNLDGWKKVADTVNQANGTLKAEGLHAGYHNHETEWAKLEDERPMDVLSAELDRSIMLQLDVGTCLAAGSDPVAWIKQNPGRIRSMHLKDWSPRKGYEVLTGEGIAPWKEIFSAGETVGGVEYYLIEQEGSAYSQIESARRCLQAYRKLHA
jgi:sugar phosphate isomerase/epimerase